PTGRICGTSVTPRGCASSRSTVRTLSGARSTARVHKVGRALGQPEGGQSKNLRCRICALRSPSRYSARPGCRSYVPRGRRRACWSAVTTPPRSARLEGEEQRAPEMCPVGEPDRRHRDQHHDRHAGHPHPSRHRGHHGRRRQQESQSEQGPGPHDVADPVVASEVGAALGDLRAPHVDVGHRRGGTEPEAEGRGDRREGPPRCSHHVGRVTGRRRKRPTSFMQLVAQSLGRTYGRSCRAQRASPPAKGTPVALPSVLAGPLAVPVLASPMFIYSGPELVAAQCQAGVIGAFPSLNARPQSALAEWLEQITESNAAYAEANPDEYVAPFAVNLIVHRSNDRLSEDLATVVEYEVPIVITSLGAREDVYEAVHSYGGIVLHDVINDVFARKAIAKGADGLIAVAAGAGGHAGTQSPSAPMQEIRAWFDGPRIRSGAIAHGRSILAARAAGADLAYVGSAFLAAEESRAPEYYKQMIVDSSAGDIVYSNLFTGIHGNYLRGSIE